MKHYQTPDIKNVALLGHSSCGKTSLAEAMLYTAGVTERLGKVSDGNTVTDFDPEEKKRKVSIASAVVSLEWKDKKINLLDAPGLFDFATGTHEAIRAAGTALIVLSAKSGLNSGSEIAYKYASKRGLKKVFFITKADSEHANCGDVIRQLKEIYGNAICPIIIPHAVNHKVECYVNLVTGKTWKYENGKAIQIERPDMGGKFEEMYRLLCESVATTSEELMEKFFSGEEFTEDEIFEGLKNGVATGEIAPVYCGSGICCEGVNLLLNAIVKILPSATEVGSEKGTTPDGEIVDIECKESGPLVATVFKTVADPFIGKLTYFKVISGKLLPNTTVYNNTTGETEKIGKITCPLGSKQLETDYVIAGDIGTAAKLTSFQTGDTMTSPDYKVTLNKVKIQNATISMAIRPVKKGDEDKIAQAIFRLMEEDPTITFVNDKETHEQVISGLGEQQLDVIVSRLKTKYGVDVVLSVPKTAYRETIRKKVKVQGRYKKQSGGHGQFGDVWIEFEPTDSEGLVFEEKVFGGSVPKNYFPAVEKGLLECMKNGVLAGYPVVGVKATLVDGSYHPVDSSEMSFKLAAGVAFKTGIEQALPVLLEPIGSLKVAVPDENMGDIIGEINKRRGRVLGMNPTDNGYQEIVAETPVADMYDFSTALRSMTKGRGNFELTFERYEEMPKPIADKIIEEKKTE